MMRNLLDHLPFAIRDAISKGKFQVVLHYCDSMSDTADNLVLKANLYEWMGLYQNAIDALTRGMRLVARKQHAPLLWSRAQLYLRVQLPALSENDIDQILDIDKKKAPTAYLVRAYARLMLGDFKGALDDSDLADKNATLVLDRIVTSRWIQHFAHAKLVHKNNMHEHLE